MKEILKELSGILEIPETEIKTHCTVFEDNKGCINIVNIPKIRPRTKHIGLNYYHFREHAKNKTVSVKYVDTKEQIADMFTKAMHELQFNYLRDKFMT